MSLVEHSVSINTAKRSKSKARLGATLSMQLLVALYLTPCSATPSGATQHRALIPHIPIAPKNFISVAGTTIVDLPDPSDLDLVPVAIELGEVTSRSRAAGLPTPKVLFS